MPTETRLPFLRRMLCIFPPRSQWRALAVPIAAALGAGLALRLAYPPFEWAWVAWVAPIGFLAALRELDARQGAWVGWLFGLAFYYPNLTWLNTLTFVNPLAPLGVAALGAACALYSAAFAAAATVFLRHSGAGAWFLAAAAWAGLEYLRALGEMGFPWIYLGHSQVTCLPIVQCCDLTGVYGVSFLIVLSGAGVVEALRPRSGISRIGRFVPLAVALALVGLALLYGRARLSQAPPLGDISGARVALLQPGIAQEMKLASYASPDATERARLQIQMARGLEDLVARVRADKPDLVVMPESAITHPFFNMRSDLVKMAEEWARQAGAPLILGANRFDPPAGLSPRQGGYFEKGHLYNSAYLVLPERGLMPPAYDKMHLVPFGEYASYFDIIPGFTRYILGIGNFTPGRLARVLPAAGRRLAPLICFESCFPYLVRQYAASGMADALVVVTNDAWYKMSTGARRHQTQAVFRAIESRLPVVRVANTGISCLIDPWGRTTASLPLREGEAMHTVAPLPYPAPNGPTPYMHPWGEWFAWLCVSSCIPGLVLIWLKSRRKTSAPRSKP